MIALLSGGPAISLWKWCRDFRRVLPFAREKDNNVFLFPFLSRLFLFCFSLPFFLFFLLNAAASGASMRWKKWRKKSGKIKWRLCFCFYFPALFLYASGRVLRALFLFFLFSFSFAPFLIAAWSMVHTSAKQRNAKKQCKKRVASLLFHLFFRLSFRCYSCTHNPF